LSPHNARIEFWKIVRGVKRDVTRQNSVQPAGQPQSSDADLGDSHAITVKAVESGELREKVADAAFFLGSSLYNQGRYAESAKAYQRCLEIRHDDPKVMNNAGLSLADAGDYAAAEPLYRRALAIDEKALGPDHPTVATRAECGESACMARIPPAAPSAADVLGVS
jgi:tetratricopeptide (TPR) repeat protein